MLRVSNFKLGEAMTWAWCAHAMGKAKKEVLLHLGV